MNIKQLAEEIQDLKYECGVDGLTLSANPYTGNVHIDFVVADQSVDMYEHLSASTGFPDQMKSVERSRVEVWAKEMQAEKRARIHQAEMDKLNAEEEARVA